MQKIDFESQIFSLFDNLPLTVKHVGQKAQVSCAFWDKLNLLILIHVFFIFSFFFSFSGINQHENPSHIFYGFNVDTGVISR